MPITKAAKDEANFDNKIEVIEKSFVDKVLGDISKTSATKQIVLGASSGWMTGFVAMKVGKAAAFAVGGGIILLQIANEKGYVRINWDKVNKQLDKVSDKVEEKMSGEGPSWMDKMERYVDRKLDKAEGVLKNQQTKARKWYSGQPSRELHIFFLSYIAGLAIGIATS